MPTVICKSLSPLLLAPHKYARNLLQLRRAALSAVTGQVFEPGPLFTDWTLFSYFLLCGDGLLKADNLQFDNDLFGEFHDTVVTRLTQFEPHRNAFNALFNKVIRQPILTFLDLRGILNLFLFSPFLNSNFLLNLLGLFIKLDTRPMRILFTAFLNYPSLLKIVLDTVQQILTAVLREPGQSAHGPRLHEVAGLIELLADANQRSKSPIPAAHFVSDALMDLLMPDLELSLIVTREQGAFSYLGTPSIVSPLFKQQLLKSESRKKGKFHVKLRRESVVEDTMARIYPSEPKMLQQQLVVEFEGEAARDDGGVSREFFDLVCTKVFAESQVFTKVNNDAFYWFRGDVDFAPEMESRLCAAGLILQLALVNGVILPVRFPRALYRKLKGEHVGLSEFAELFPEQAASLRQCGTGCGLYFVVNVVNSSGEVLEKELVPNGENIEVTNENAGDYVRSIVAFYMEVGVAKSFEQFAAGFRRARETKVMAKLRAFDYDLLLSGSDVEDWNELERQTTYIGGYDPTSPAVVIFWRLFYEMCEEAKGKLLQFITGSSRAPLGGFKTLGFRIQRAGDARKVPTAHTCQNMLVLPDCRDEGRVRGNLAVCIAHAEGFGFI
jgi:hypothetical protein